MSAPVRGGDETSSARVCAHTPAGRRGDAGDPVGAPVFLSNSATDALGGGTWAVIPCASLA